MSFLQLAFVERVFAMQLRGERLPIGGLNWNWMLIVSQYLTYIFDLT